jgi:opacity protein-like surface antigen
MKKLIKTLTFLTLFLSFNVFAWQLQPGAAKDTADGWVIGTNVEAGGFGIYRWNSGSWQKIPGSAIRIGGTFRTPWVVNKFKQIFRWTGSAWQLMPGAANDVADGWVIGTNVEAGGYGIYRWNGASWTKIPGSAVRIGGTYSQPWVVNKFNQIFRWTGSSWQLMPGAAYDVADGWVIGTNPEAGGYGIYRWDSASWTKIAGSALSNGGAGGPPWVVNKFSQIFRW